MTSNQALQQIKKILQIKNRAGHTGTLDPLATGLLPICIGEATKFARFLLDSHKKYQVTMQLGIKTNTADILGKIILKNYDINQFDLNSNLIQENLAWFIGEITQTPPVYSAIKINGIRAYKLARKLEATSQNVADSKVGSTSENITGPNVKATSETVTDSKVEIHIEMPTRTINIYSIKLLNICNLNKQITLEVHCSKGTYIRSLVEDIGKKLNCFATVIALRRIAIGDLSINNNNLKHYVFNMNQLNEIINNDLNNLNLQTLLLPIKFCLNTLPQLIISEEQAKILLHGKTLYIKNLNHLFTKDTLVKLITNSEVFLGIAKVKGETVVSKRLVNYYFNLKK